MQHRWLQIDLCVHFSSKISCLDYGGLVSYIPWRTGVYIRRDNFTLPRLSYIELFIFGSNSKIFDVQMCVNDIQVYHSEKKNSMYFSIILYIASTIAI